MKLNDYFNCFICQIKNTGSVFFRNRTRYFYGGGRGIRTPVGLHPNGFQDRLVMTASICLRKRYTYCITFFDHGRFPLRQHKTQSNPILQVSRNIYYTKIFVLSSYLKACPRFYTDFSHVNFRPLYAFFCPNCSPPIKPDGVSLAKGITGKDKNDSIVKGSVSSSKPCCLRKECIFSSISAVCT